MTEETQKPTEENQAPKATFSEEQQKHIDEIFNKRFKSTEEKHSKELEALKQQHLKDLEETEKKSKLKADELKEYENSKIAEELKQLKEEKEKRDFADKSKIVLSDCKVSEKYHYLFARETSLEDVKKSADKFVKDYESDVLAEVNKRMVGHTPKTQETTTTPASSAIRQAMGLK